MPKTLALLLAIICSSGVSVSRAQEKSKRPSNGTGEETKPELAQPLQLTAVAEEKAANGIIVSYTFSSSVRAYPSSFFTWTPLKPPPQSGSTHKDPATFDPTNPSKISLTIAYPFVGDVDAVAVVASIADASATALVTPALTIDLSDTHLFSAEQAKSSALAESNEALRTQVDILSRSYDALRTGVLPQAISPSGYLFVSDSSIVIKFVTDSYGILQVTSREAPSQVVKTQPGKEHIARFDKLNSNTEYHFAATVIDPATGKPTSVRTNPADPLLVKKTLESKPIVTFSTTVEGLNSAIKVEIHSDHVGVSGVAPKLAYNISCRRVLSKSPLSTQEVPGATGFSIDDVGVPESDFDQQAFAIIGNLAANTEYQVFVEAVDQLGRQYGKSQYSATTLGAFDFDGPINVQINPSGGITANWKATRAPKAADMTIRFQNVPIPLKSNADGQTVTISAKSDAPQLFSALQKALPNETPIMHIEMKSDSGETVARDFSVSFVIAKNSKTAAGVEKSNADAVGKLSQAAQDASKKVNWKDILNAGLSILLKAI